MFINIELVTEINDNTTSHLLQGGVGWGYEHLPFKFLLYELSITYIIKINIFKIINKYGSFTVTFSITSETEVSREE